MEWYPWYPALYRADTIHLTAEQDGIYRRLIDHYMETRQPLPNNDAALARIAGITLDSWAIAAAIILPFFTTTKNGKLHLKRCDAELERQDGRNRLQSEKGKSGAKKRWENKQQEQYINSSGYACAIATPMPSDARGEDKTREDNIKKDNTIVLSKENISKDEKKKRATRLPDDWDLPQEWGEWCLPFGMSEAEINREGEKFKDYWIATGKTKADWQATWRNWIRNTLERKK